MNLFIDLAILVFCIWFSCFTLSHLVITMIILIKNQTTTSGHQLFLVDKFPIDYKQSWILWSICQYHTASKLLTTLVLCLQLQVISKNWKEAKEKESPDLLCISELFHQRKLCYMNVYACISKMVLATSPTSHLGHLSVIDKHSLKERNEIVRDFITAGCKLCGSPLYHK